MVWATVAVLTWRGPARVMAAVPLVAVLLFTVLVLVPDLLEDRSSHNLLPFEVGAWLWTSLPWMALVEVGRRTAREP
jgi:hypothetical protein